MDADLQARIAELEQRQSRFKLATTGMEGWENYFQNLILQERDYFLELLTMTIAQFHRQITAEAKVMLDQALETRVRGTFQSGTSYARGDLVVRDGASFVARRDNPGPCPGAGWQMTAKQGARGIAGPQGIAGKDSPRITKWELDVASYTATPIMSDGSRGPGLELRALFEDVDSTPA
jgi:hypothetical protein